ncbi:MAG TPA: CPBP family glutamic-type intramembrane protease [Nakamurella sp.]
MRTWPGRLGSALRPALVDKVDRDHRQSDAEFLRRRIVVGVTLVIGAILLGFSLNVSPGSTAFYTLTIALAATWVIGGFVSGPLHLGRINFRGELRRPIVLPILLGLATAAVFILGAVIVREIEPLRASTENVLAFARYGSLPLVTMVTLMNGVAEEIFFRGALFAAIGVWHPVAISTVIYTLTTVATGNVMLVFSAATLGLLLGLQRRASGGILGPILTHCTWSMAMLLLLPPVFAAAG